METGFDSQTEVTLFPCGAAVAQLTVNQWVASSNLAGGVGSSSDLPNCCLRWKDKPECRSNKQNKGSKLLFS